SCSNILPRRNRLNLLPIAGLKSVRRSRPSILSSTATPFSMAVSVRMPIACPSPSGSVIALRCARRPCPARLNSFWVPTAPRMASIARNRPAAVPASSTPPSRWKAMR
ncbi:hypothetical protein LTR94_034692, partial [Friedmanniomyces endolithicus]